MNADGTAFMLLHSFGTALDDGNSPLPSLLLAKDSMLYGTTMGSSQSTGGNIFRVKTDGSDFLVLHRFSQDLQVGVPQNLMQGNDGILYGLTSLAQAPGTAFQINPDGTQYTVLHAFSGFSDGRMPQGPLLQGSDGAFYGTTSLGGVAFVGTVFRMTVVPSSPPPFVLALIPLADGSFHIEFDGIVGSNYQLEASSDLADWSTLGTVSNETGRVQFIDANETKPVQKFYRAGITH
jgi:hypothetical protein